MPNPTCTVDGCDKPTRSGRAQWCKMHYHRWYRHGDVHRVARGSTLDASAGKYRIAELPRHPVAGPCGKAYVHRVVLYDSIGPGWHPCHWCQRMVTWDKDTTDPDGLQVDHLNSIKDANDRDNLVVSCRGCNVGRGAQARSDRLREAGWWSTHDTVAVLGRRPRVAT